MINFRSLSKLFKLLIKQEKHFNRSAFYVYLIGIKIP